MADAKRGNVARRGDISGRADVTELTAYELQFLIAQNVIVVVVRHYQYPSTGGKGLGPYFVALRYFRQHGGELNVLFLGADGKLFPQSGIEFLNAQMARNS